MAQLVAMTSLMREGADALPEEQVSQFQVVVDEGVSMLGIVPNALPPKPIVLRHVEPGSWADQNGVARGDELVAINDVRVSEITLKGLDNYLRRERPLRLTFVCKKVKDMERMTSDEFKGLKRANTGEIDEFAEKLDDSTELSHAPAVPREMTPVPPAPAAFPLGAGMDGEGDAQELLGTWVYSNAYEYTLCRTLGGQLLFEEKRTDELQPSMVKRVSGTLRQEGAWLEGEIADGEMRQLGWIRLRFDRDSGTMVSNVKLCQEEAWSDDTTARRKVEEPSIAPVVELSEEPEPPVMRAARPQVVDGSPVLPQHWGITRAQCRELLSRLRKDPTWDPSNTVYTLVADYVVPWTRGTGMGYALLLNKGAPKEVNVMVSHAWGENAEEFLKAVGRSTGKRDVLFICAFSLYQAEDAAGPSIKEQLGLEPGEAPLQRVLEHIQAQGRRDGCCWRWRACLHWLPAFFAVLGLLIFLSPIIAWGCVPSYDSLRCVVRRTSEVDGLRKTEWAWLEDYADWAQGAGGQLRQLLLVRAAYPAVAGCLAIAGILWLALWRCRIYNGRLLAVPNFECSLYSRLWCVHEVSAAKALKVPVVLANTLAQTGRCRSCRAQCTLEIDRDRILKMIEQDGKKGYRAVDKALRAMSLRRQCNMLLTLARWALLLALLRCADRRLFLTPGTWEAGPQSLEPYLCSVAGVAAGTLLDVLAMCLVAWQARGVPRCWAVSAVACLLLGAAVGIAAGLMQLGEIGRDLPRHWQPGLGLLTDDCFGYLQPGRPGDQGCPNLLRFLSSLCQALLLGGFFLWAFTLGGLCCPARLKGGLCAAAFAVLVAAALLAASVRAEPGLPERDQAFPVAVFYLVALLSRSLAPLAAMWAAISRWGIRLRTRRCGSSRKRPPASRARAGWGAGGHEETHASL